MEEEATTSSVNHTPRPDHIVQITRASYPRPHKTNLEVLSVVILVVGIAESLILSGKFALPIKHFAALLP